MKFIIFVVVMFGIALSILASGFTLPIEATLPIFLVAIGLDFFTTWRCLRKGRKEGNPIIAYLFRRLGVPTSFILLACIWALFIGFRWMGAGEGVQTATAFVYWVIPINNLIVLRRMKRNFA